MIFSNGNTVPLLIGTIGDETPILADSRYYSRSAIELSGRWAAYAAMYKDQVWVNTVISKLADATARLPLDVKRQSDSSNAQIPEAGPLSELMRRPNPEIDGYRLMYWTAATHWLYGEAFWLKIRDINGRVRQLVPMNPKNVIVGRSATTGEIEYTYSVGVRGTGLLGVLSANDVVPFLSYNPENVLRGLSKLEPLRQTLLNEDAARRATSSWWANGARPSVVLTHPATLSQGAQDRIRANWTANYSGADNMGRSAILEENMKAQIVQLNAEEMQYIESRKLNREEVCAAYDVPPPVVHILDRATYSNITEQLRSMYRDTMAGKLGAFESVINHHLVPDFYPDGSVFTRFNMDEVLRGDFETRATAASTLISNGVLKPSEARPMFGLPDVGPVADVLYANAALVALGSSTAVPGVAPVLGEPAVPALPPTPPTPALTASPTTTPVKELPAAPVAWSVRGIKATAGRASSLASARKALVGQHEKAMTGYFAEQAKSLTAGQKSATDGGYDPADWFDKLNLLLSTLGLATAEAMGGRIAKALGGVYTLEAVTAFLADDAAATAAAINVTTGQQITAAIAKATEEETDTGDALHHLFSVGGLVAARAGQIAMTRVATMAGYATVDAGRQHGATHKTWRLGSGKPRSTHARMNGQTVPIHELFSNRMDFPGDGSDENETAGCTCYCDITRTDK